MTTVQRRVRPDSARARAASQKQLAERTTTTQLKSTQAETSQEEKLSALVIPEGAEVAQVKIGVGGTYNLGNYESLRIEVSVTVPCAIEDVDKAVVLASEFVGDKLQEEEEVWMGSRVSHRQRQA